MPYGTVYITTQGAILAAKTLESKKLKFSHFAVGDGTIADPTVQNIKALEDLINEKKSFDITKVERDTDTQVTVRGLFKNTDVATAFYLKELGLFAIDPDSKEEVLFAYINYGAEAEYINNSISEKKEHYYDMIVTVDNADNVTITIDENSVYVTEKELEEALKDAKLYSGKNYGIKRRITDNVVSSWTRICDSVGLVANATKNGTEVQNDFDNCYPWSEIKRCNVDTVTGKITWYYGEPSYSTTGTSKQVMVRIPEFYWKRERKIEDDGDEYEYIYISDYHRAGYTKSEEFLVGAYLLGKGVRTGGTPSATVPVTDAAISRSGEIPLYNTNLATFRNYAKKAGPGFQLMDYHYFLLQMLYLVEYADYNSQAKLGQGISIMGTATAIKAEESTLSICVNSVPASLYIGKTVCIGTSGAWNSNVAADRTITNIYTANTADGSTYKRIEFDGEPVSIAVGNVIWGSAQKTGGNDVLGNKSGCLVNDSCHAVSYRGIEDIFGNIWQHIDGLNINDYQAYICRDPASYENNKYDAPYVKIGYINSDASDSPCKKLGYDSSNPEIALPVECGASSTTGTCDNYWSAAGTRIAFVGGYFNTEFRGGFFGWLVFWDNASTYVGSGARLLQMPVK